ncbi:MAG: PKD domain-containing protein [Bacteroidetes bacterium]|nr:PKD domain-containing protein [Bacteroidota bacterium]
MKNIIKNISRIGRYTLLIAGLGLAADKAAAQITTQMSGNYTLDRSVPCSGTNFKNLYSFFRAMQGLTRTDTTVASLQYNNTTGIGGPITLDVKTDYSDVTQVSIPQITNMGSSNPITINGNGFIGTYSSTDAYILFNGADYITINKLYIRMTSTSTTQSGIRFANGSDYNTIDGCTIDLAGLVTGSSTSSAYIAFAATSALGSTTSTNTGSYCTITNCTMKTSAVNPAGPYYGIVHQGNTAAYSSTANNNTFSNNKITNFYVYGIYNYYCNGNVIQNNDISRNDATSSSSMSATQYGIYTYYPYSTSRNIVVSDNYIHDLPSLYALPTSTSLTTFYGLYAYYPQGSAARPMKIERNTYKNVYTSTSTSYTNYVYYPSYVDIQDNKIENIQSNGTSATLYNWYVYYPTGVRCNRNVVTKCSTNYYLYNFYLYYGSVGTYTWNEFNDNYVTYNKAVNYMYNAYLYYYTGTNNWQALRNEIMGNTCTGSTAYMYNLYIYYAMNYQVCGNVSAGNYSNSQYNYIYSGLSGSYTAEVRNNTFEMDMTGVPTPGSSYSYMYFYLYYHTVRFTGNIISMKGTGSQYYRYLYMYLAYSNPTQLLEFDRNTYWLNNLYTYPYWYFNGSNYTDWAGFSGAGMNGPNDKGQDPLFIDIPNKDFRAGAWFTQNDVPYLAVNDKDAASVSRNKVRHDRGGLETYTDLELVNTNFSVPSVVCAGYTTGATSITVKSNYTYDKAVNFKVSYSVNGGGKISQTVTKALAAGDTAKVWFPTALMLNQTGNSRIAIFVDLPDDNNSNDSQIFYTFVKPAPGGGRYSFSPKPTVAFYQGTKGNDVTILKAPVIYTVNAPRIYSNSDYGTSWTASAFAITTGGNMRPSSEITYTAPSGGNDLEVQFKTSDANMEDSTITVVTKVTDLTNGCDTFIRRNVLLYPTIVAKFVFPSKICDGDQVLFENKSTVRSGTMDFEWDFGTGKVADKSFAPEPVFQFPGPGTYKVRLLEKTLPYGFPSWDSAMVTVGAVPVVGFTKKNACDGYPVEFTNTSGTATYKWLFGDNTNSTATNPTHKYSTPGTYKVTLQATQNGCTSSITQNVYQFDKPKAMWTRGAGICDNESISFMNNSTIASGIAGSWWDFSDGNVSTEMNPQHEFGTPGAKSVKLIVTSEFGCKDSFTNTVNVKESPKVAFTNTPACSLTPTVFTNTTADVAGALPTYNWNFGDGGVSGTKSPSHAWSSLGSKNVTLKITLDNGCKSEISKLITVGVQPKASFTAGDVCAGDKVVFDNQTTWAQGDITYNWNFADGNSSTESDPVKKYNVSTTTTYTVTLKASIAGGCSDSFSKQITVNEGPKTCDFSATPDYGFRHFGMKFESLDGNGAPFTQPSVSYTYVIETGGTKAGSNIQHDFGKDGEYVVTMRAVVDASGCECTKTKTVVLNRTAVKDLTETGVAVYPNPNSGQFRIALNGDFGTKVQVELMSLSGAVVKSNAFANNGIIDIQAPELSNGMYMVRVSGNGKVATRKINIQH